MLFCGEPQERLYLDAANRVIISIREEQKETWIEVFTDLSGFGTKQHALDRLRGAPKFAQRVDDVAKTIDTSAIEQRFEQFLAEMTGGREPLQYDCGKWLHLIRGKPVLPLVVGPCFTVKDRDGEPLQGQVKMNEVAKALVRLPLDQQPPDFQELHRLIMQRVNQS